MSEFDITALDDFGSIQTRQRSLKNLVDALQTRIHKQDTTINNMNNEITDLKKQLLVMRNQY